MAQIGEFVTLDVAAKKLGVSYMKVWRRVNQGGIPTFRIGKSILVRVQDVKPTKLKTRQ